MGDKIEYIGRSLTVACRLQGAIKDDTRDPAYKALMSKNVYQRNCLTRGRNEQDFSFFMPKRTSRNLKNILGNESFECVELTIIYQSDPASETLIKLILDSQKNKNPFEKA
jgi:hypothetical protein